MDRKHDRGGFCTVCGASDPAIGSACNVPKLGSAATPLHIGRTDRERRSAIESAEALAEKIADFATMIVADGGHVARHGCVVTATTERGEFTLTVGADVEFRIPSDSDPNLHKTGRR